MFPEDAKIKEVDIFASFNFRDPYGRLQHHTDERDPNTIYTKVYNQITGFEFFDCEGDVIMKFGETVSSDKVQTVVLEENERIVGVIARSGKLDINAYTNFQFQIAQGQYRYVKKTNLTEEFLKTL